jgi:hypothetical protein
MTTVTVTAASCCNKVAMPHRSTPSPVRVGRVGYLINTTIVTMAQ